MPTIHIKRIYEKPSPDDGVRVLVDRLWPRGVSKEEASLDEWLKDIAPSTGLREWFDHKPERFAEFSQKYEHELSINRAVDVLKSLLKKHATVTLLYGAKDPQINHAVVLQHYIEHPRRS